MDKVGADFEMTIESIRSKLLANPILLELPIGAEGSFSGIIDLIKMRAVFWDSENLGVTFGETEIPKELQAQVKKYRHQMLELAAEHDEEMMNLYVHNENPGIEIIDRAVRCGTLSGKLQPVFVGSALKYIGVQKLLDGVIKYLPSPLDKPPIVVHKPTDKNKTVTVKCDKNGHLVALVFKIISDAHGDLNFLRIYQGTLKSSSRVLVANRNKKENITRIFEMHANERKIVDSASAGDIVAVVGPKETLTGDTICDTRNPVCLPSISFPETVISMSIEPQTSADKAKLLEGLLYLRREDPTFEYKYDSETGQTIINGMGELHLEVLQHKLIKEKGIGVRIGTPKVAYKEAITKKAQAEGKFIRQTGGRGQYGHVVLTVEPLFAEDGHWSRDIEFQNKVVSGAVPREYIPGVEAGSKNALTCGALAGYPIVGVKITLIDGSYHSVDSSELAFEQAAAIAVEKAIKEAGPVLLEPIMRLQVVVPEANFGAIQGNLLAKRGLITNCRAHGNMQIIDAKVPLAEMFGYSSEIRSLTAGRGTFTMEPLSYERVPEQIAGKIII
jgi:elongation factor G